MKIIDLNGGMFFQPSKIVAFVVEGDKIMIHVEGVFATFTLVCESEEKAREYAKKISIELRDY